MLPVDGPLFSQLGGPLESGRLFKVPDHELLPSDLPAYLVDRFSPFLRPDGQRGDVARSF